MIEKLRKNEAKSTIPTRVIINNSSKQNKITNNNFNKNQSTIKPVESHYSNINKSTNKKFDFDFENFKKTKEGNLLPDKRETILLKKEVLGNTSRRISNYIMKRKSEINSCKSPETHRETLKSSEIGKKYSSNLNVNVFCSPRKSSTGDNYNYFEKESTYNSNSNFNSPYTIRYPGGPTSKNESPKNLRNSYSTNYKSKSCMHSPARGVRSPSRQSLGNSNEFQNFHVDFSSLEDTKQQEYQVMTPSETMDHFPDQDFVNQELDNSLLSMNKDLTQGKGGRIEIFKNPNSKNSYRISYDLYDKNKIIIIQRLWRGHFLRSQLYDILVRYYKGLAFEKRIKNFIKKIQIKYFVNFLKNFKLFNKNSKINISSSTNIKVNACELEILNKKNILSNTLISLDAMNELKLKIIKEYIINKTKNLETKKCHSFSLVGEKKISKNINPELNLEKNSSYNQEEKNIFEMVKKLHDDKINELKNLEQILDSFNKKSDSNLNSEISTNESLEFSKKFENNNLSNKEVTGLAQSREEIKKSDKEKDSKIKKEGLGILI
jgi:hypothetical protein